MHCPYCSRPLSDKEQNYCGYCGRSLIIEEDPQFHESPPHSRDQAPVIVELPKSRFIYIVLAIFLGWLGMHNFYAGYVFRGLIQFVFGAFWALVFQPVLLIYIPLLILEILFIRRDARGIRMS